MNKWEKEVFQAGLDSEEAVIKDLEKQYKKALADIETKIKLLQADELTQSKIYQLEYQKALKGQIEGILEKLHGDEYSTIQDYLRGCYENGFIGTAYDLAGQGIPLIMPIDQAAAVKAIITDSQINGSLYGALGVDAAKLKKAIRHEITRGLASGLSYSDIARNISAVSKAPFSNAKRIVRTEGHRIQQASTMDAQNRAKAKGANVVKQWDSTLDGNTRPTHRMLDGQIREIDEPFQAHGQKAMYPGDFGDPAEDCNCRCVSCTRARWALDESELQTLRDRAEYFGLDKMDEFEDFKKKYLNAAKSIENSEKSGTMRVDIQFFANKSIAKQTDKQLGKSIASWKENVELHEAKIKNPENYVQDWNSLSDLQKNGLIRHWKKEIHYFKENVNDAEAELIKRGRSE